MGQTHIWDGQTDTHVGRTDRQTDRQTHTHTDTHTYGTEQTHMWDRQTDRHMGQTDRHTLVSLKNIYAKTFLCVHQSLPKYF